MNKYLPAAALVGSVLVLSACQSSKHTTTEPKDGTVIACTECYDQIYQMKHQQMDTTRGAMVTETHRHHACAACKTEVSIYTENGVTKVRCAKCAPQGVDCDKCLPPKGYTPKPQESGATSRTSKDEPSAQR